MKSTLQLKAVCFLLLSINSINKTFAQPGTLDKSFGDGGKDTVAMLVTKKGDSQTEQIQKILIQKDQKIVVVGFTLNEPQTGEKADASIGIARYNSDGSLDMTFANKGKISKDTFYSNDAALQSNDKIIVVGDRLNSNYYGYPLLARFRKNGAIDTSFGIKGFSDTTGKAHNRFYKTEILKDNSIIIIGAFVLDDSLHHSYYYVEKYLPNGTLDSSFGNTGKLILKEQANYYTDKFIVQPDDKILIETSYYSYDSLHNEVIRITSSGKYDLSFGDSGKIVTGINPLIGLLSNGKIITRDSHVLTKYNSNGNIDSTFGINGRVSINDSVEEASILIQKDNKIVFSGSYYDKSQTRYSYSNFALSRFNANGSIDSSFGNHGLTITDFGTPSNSYCSALQNDNKILIGGRCDRLLNPEYREENFAIARYNNDDNVLPVSLLSFTATKQQQSVLLNWQTANEINRNYFSVQRSNNSRSFIEINKVYNAKNLSKTNSYNTTDLQPLKGWNYYRLKQVDKDGKFTYSKIISVYFDEDVKILIYPNPANDYIYVDGLNENISANISIEDVNGKTVSSIKTNQSTNKINIQNLVAGIYYININQNGESFKEKFIKQ